MTGGGGLCVGRDGDTAEATADGLARLCLKAGGCGHGRKPKVYRDFPAHVSDDRWLGMLR